MEDDSEEEADLNGTNQRTGGHECRILVEGGSAIRLEEEQIAQSGLAIAVPRDQQLPLDGDVASLVAALPEEFQQIGPQILSCEPVLRGNSLAVPFGPAQIDRVWKGLLIVRVPDHQISQL